MGWFIGTILGIAIRLEFGVLMIPVQAIVGLCQPHKNQAEIVSRIVAIATVAAALGILYYELQHK
jgi:choline-glycine betaine transporter